MKPVFCSEEPSFMGGILNGDEIREQAVELRKNPINKNKGFISCYFHGKLENKMGYDIVNHVDGTIPKLINGSKIDCIAILPDGTQTDAVLIVTTKNRLSTIETLIVEQGDEQSAYDYFDLCYN